MVVGDDCDFSAVYVGTKFLKSANDSEALLISCRVSRFGVSGGATSACENLFFPVGPRLSQDGNDAVFASVRAYGDGQGGIEVAEKGRLIRCC